jgi:prevent-host-death family protein
MGTRHSITEARTTLPQLIRQAEAGEVVELPRQGEGVAVLIGRKQYEQLVSGRRSFADAWADFVRDVDLRELIPTRCLPEVGTTIRAGVIPAVVRHERRFGGGRLPISNAAKPERGTSPTSWPR